MMLNNNKKLTWIKEDYYKNRCKYILKNILLRCNNPKSVSYAWYGGKGIKCNITLKELKSIWKRDKAYEMKNPSISRKDHSKDYTYDNCKFEEKRKNIGESNKRTKSVSVLQYSLKGQFIKEWFGTREVERKLNIHHSNISSCCKGSYKTTGGFIWKYKTENNIKNLSKKELLNYKNPICKIIKQYNLQGKEIQEWESIQKVERVLGFSHQSIGKCCLGKQKTAYGFIWKYK